jgi:hypothetical protein
MLGHVSDYTNVSPFVRLRGKLFWMARWCTVTVTDGDGRRHSLDVLADSSYDAAHLYLHAAKSNPSSALPVPTRETVFDVVAEGKVHHVTGDRLRDWIEKRREEFKGPRGYLFGQRAVMD